MLFNINYFTIEKRCYLISYRTVLLFFFAEKRMAYNLTRKIKERLLIAWSTQATTTQNCYFKQVLSKYGNLEPCFSQDYYCEVNRRSLRQHSTTVRRIHFSQFYLLSALIYMVRKGPSEWNRRLALTAFVQLLITPKNALSTPRRLNKDLISIVTI